MRRIAILMSVLFTCFISATWPQAQTRPQIITFDAPGAGASASQGTFAIGIIQSGAIVGQYQDAGNVFHGFLRSPDGKFTTFDPPGAGTGSGQGTNAVLGLNQEGAIVGGYIDANFAAHGFLRSRDGEFTTFDAPGACTTSILVGCHGTGAFNINVFGTIVGTYEDASGNFVAHAFIRFPDGTFTTFEAPGAGIGPGQGTVTAAFTGLNQSGAITGDYVDVNNVLHGFLRSPGGTFTTFEAPGANTTTPPAGTLPTSLNQFGAITGSFLDANSVIHGFLRSPDGIFATFEAPGADTTAGSFNGTLPENINLHGAITGQYLDANGVNHGFLRAPSGAITTFDAPGAGTGPGQGTIPTSNNVGGAITGSYIDANGVNHGFLRTP